MDIFFILIFQFVKYSMMLQWLYNHLFQAVQSMFQLIQVNRPMCNHLLRVTFLILELKFYCPHNCSLNLKNSARICWSPDTYSSNAITSKLHQALRLLK